MSQATDKPSKSWELNRYLNLRNLLAQTPKRKRILGKNNANVVQVINSVWDSSFLNRVRVSAGKGSWDKERANGLSLTIEKVVQSVETD